jgi:hypothetical protein
MLVQSSTPGTFPRIADIIAGDFHDRSDQLVIPDAAIVRPGYCA